MTGLTDVVVIGGGLAGVSVTEHLRRRGYRGRLTLVDAGTLLHDRPPLSKGYLSGAADEDTIRLRPAHWFARHDIRVLLGTTVDRVVPEEHLVVLSDGRRLTAQRAVLATGAAARPLPVPGGDDPRVHRLRTVEDARALRPALTPGSTLLVVGAGLIGAEVAATARGLGVEVVLTDPELPLSGVLGEPVARSLHDQHAAHGAEVLDRAVQAIDVDGPRLTVHLADGTARRVDAVVAGIGMLPDTRVAEASGLAVDGGVLVDEHQRSSAAGVYAVGDCARTVRDGVPQPQPGHWEAAAVTAERAVADILGLEPPAASAPWWWSDRYGHHVEVVGDPTDGDPVVRGRIGEPPYVVFAVRGDVVRGAVAVDQPKAVKAARRLIDRAIAVDPAALADASTVLRGLLRG